MVLQAGTRGGGVTAAVRNGIQQVTTVHVTPDTTRERGGRDGEKTDDGNRLEEDRMGESREETKKGRKEEGTSIIWVVKHRNVQTG